LSSAACHSCNASQQRASTEVGLSGPSRLPPLLLLLLLLCHIILGLCCDCCSLLLLPLLALQAVLACLCVALA
jgi:hypothetical protein